MATMCSCTPSMNDGALFHQPSCATMTPTPPPGERERLARLLHETWSNGLSSWEQDEIIQPAFYRQADAVMAARPAPAATGEWDALRRKVYGTIPDEFVADKVDAILRRAAPPAPASQPQDRAPGVEPDGRTG